VRFAEALTKLLAERRTAPSPLDSRGVGNPSPGGVLRGSVSGEDAGADANDSAIRELFEARASLLFSLPFSLV
jgi:hypothetical protein